MKITVSLSRLFLMISIAGILSLHFTAMGPLDWIIVAAIGVFWILYFADWKKYSRMPSGNSNSNEQQ